jgi:peroxiredoxin-like protein
VKPLPHRFEVHLEGGPTGHATATVQGAPELRSAPPAEFDGPGDAWSPEHLLLAAVETCFLFTLRAVAQASRLPFTAVSASAEGTVDRGDGALRFTEIILRARLEVPEGVERDRAVRIMEKSERACLVTASLATPVRLEAEVVTG